MYACMYVCMCVRGLHSQRFDLPTDIHTYLHTIHRAEKLAKLMEGRKKGGNDQMMMMHDAQSSLSPPREDDTAAAAAAANDDDRNSRSPTKQSSSSARSKPLLYVDVLLGKDGEAKERIPVYREDSPKKVCK